MSPRARRPASFPLLARIAYTAGLRASLPGSNGNPLPLPSLPLTGRLAYSFAPSHAHIAETAHSALDASTHTDHGNLYPRAAGRSPDERRFDPLSGNKYTDRSTAIDAIAEKYAGSAIWGNELVQAIIDHRSARVIGTGIKAQPSRKATRIATDRDTTDPLTHDDGTLAPRDPAEEFTNELTYIREWLQTYGFDGRDIHQHGVEKEIEGQLAYKLTWNDTTGYPDISHVSWQETRYDVIHTDGVPTTLTWTTRDPATQRLITHTINAADYSPDSTTPPPTEDFIFLAFNARLGSSHGTPAIAGMLQSIDRLDFDGAIWDGAIKRYGLATPKYEGLDLEEVPQVLATLEESPFRAGSTIPVTTGRVDYLTLPPGGLDSIASRIQMLVKLISGTVDVPPHILGFSDIIGTRATAQDVREEQEQRRASEREVWLGGFTQLFDKLLRMRNAHAPTDSPMLIPGTVEPAIPGTGKVARETVTSTLLPLHSKGLISTQTLHEQTPGIDPDTEAERIETEIASRTQGSELLNFVGGVDALAALAEKVSLGAMPKSAAISIATLMFKIDDERAESIFADIPDEQYDPRRLLDERTAKVGVVSAPDSTGGDQ